MKSMRPPSAAIFFMTYFHRARGGHGPLGPPLDPLLICGYNLPPRNEVCEGYVFTPVCQSFCSQVVGGGWYPSMHCRWYPSMPCSRSPVGGWYPSMPCRLPGPHPRGKLRGIRPGGSPGPQGGCLLWGVPAPGGV